MLFFSAPVAMAAGLVAHFALAAAPEKSGLSVTDISPSHVLTGEGRVGVAQRVEFVGIASAEPTPPNPPLKAGEGEVKQPVATPQITIRPGGSLWALSRELYGAGRHYGILFEANKGQIQDPRLIYPGQILDAPKQMDN